MQVLKRNKDHTVLICDDNKHEMQNLPDAIYIADPWFDPIYQEAENKKGPTVWKEVLAVKRFDNIINSAFAIKSQHSSLI